MKFLSMLIKERTEVHKPLVIYADNQGAILIAKNRQVGIRTKHINIRHHFMRDLVEEEDIDIKYIWSGDNPADIMIKNIREADLKKHIKRIT